MNSRPGLGLARPGVTRLTLCIAASFALALGLVLFLGALLAPNFSRNGPTSFDAHVTKWFIDHRSDALTTVMKAVTCVTPPYTSRDASDGATAQWGDPFIGL